MHLGICALLVACGGGNGTEPSNLEPSDPDPPTPTPPTFTIVGRGNLNQRVTSDLWVHGTVAYTGTVDLGGAGIAANTLWVWDVSNPATPVRAASVVVDGVGTVGDVKIRADGTLGVITHEGSTDGLNGVTLIDLSNPLQPSVISRTLTSLEGGVHNAWIEGDYVYAVGGAANGGRISIIDISNPADPRVVAGYSAGSSGAHDVYARDGLAFVSHWNAGLVILDVGNGIAGGSPTNPVEVGRVQMEGGNTHNAWYWPDAGYVFVGEESNRPGVVHVVDVSDLSNAGRGRHFRALPEGTRTTSGWMRREAFSTWHGGGKDSKAIDVSGELLGRLDDTGTASRLHQRLRGLIRHAVGVPNCTTAWSTCRR